MQLASNVFTVTKKRRNPAISRHVVLCDQCDIHLDQKRWRFLTNRKIRLLRSENMPQLELCELIIYLVTPPEGPPISLFSAVLVSA